MTVNGLITKGVGGLYTVLSDGGTAYACRARGHFRHEGVSPTVGDSVVAVIGDEADIGEKIKKAGDTDIDGVIDSILPRKNLLIRPPFANLDVMFAVIPTCRPTARVKS